MPLKILDSSFIGDDDNDYYSDDSESVATIESVAKSTNQEEKHFVVATQENSMSGLQTELLIVGSGFMLLLLSMLYMYWITTACEVTEDIEANITTQYAIDKTQQMREMTVVSNVLEENSFPITVLD